MRRPSTLIVIVLAFVLGSAVVAAQDATPAPDVHPFVGTWLLDTEADVPGNGLSVIVVTADGGYVENDWGAFTTLGTWSSTGDTTADLTLTSTSVDEDGVDTGMQIVRASIEVDASGNGFTAEYTFDFVDAYGTATGEYGPVSATGTRLVAEPMGEPLGTLEDLFSMLEDPEATPED